MLAFRYTHPRSGADVEIRQAVRGPRNLPFDLRIGERVALVCWGVMPSGMLRHPVLRPERDLPRRGTGGSAGGALRHAERDAAMVIAEQTLEVPAGAARALLVGVRREPGEDGRGCSSGRALRYPGR